MSYETDSDAQPLDMIVEEPTREEFRRELLAGLRSNEKTAPCKYLYDERGSALFDEICNQQEYYPTRTEIAIMRKHGREMAEEIGERALIVELGSGSSIKTRILLDHLRNPAGYVPLDISREHLEQSCQSLAAAYPEIEIMPLCADYTRDIELPKPSGPVLRRVAYFPGSTIGNFHPGPAREFLARIAKLVSDGSHQGALLIGVDLKKDVAELEAAYNDAAGVTAEFNFNLLRRINRELDGDVDLSNFDFRAIWNEDEGRVESYLVSRMPQSIHIDDEEIELEQGERIRTECSYKFTIEEFASFAESAGWRLNRFWTDDDRRFAVILLEEPSP